METQFVIIFWVAFILVCLASMQAHRKFKIKTADLRAMLAKEQEDQAAAKDDRSTPN